MIYEVVLHDKELKILLPSDYCIFYNQSDNDRPHIRYGTSSQSVRLDYFIENYAGSDCNFDEYYKYCIKQREGLFDDDELPW